MKKSLLLLFVVMGLFSMFRKSSADEKPEIDLEKPGNHLAFVMLSEPALPDPDALLAAFKTFAGGDEKLIIEADEDEESADDTPDESGPSVMVVKLDGIGSAFVALADAPIPEGEAEANFEYSLSSFRDGASVEGQKAHLIVTLMGIEEETSAVDAMMAFTTLLAAVGKTTPAIGIYWGNAGATHSIDFFLETAEEHGVTPRIMLWTGISRAPEDGDRISFLSLGMNQLALPDLYLISSRDQAGQAMGMFFDLLSYVAGRGTPIPEGDTIGGTADQKIPVHYVKSPAGGDSWVWKIEL